MLPFIALLWVPSYNSIEPTLGDCTPRQEAQNPWALIAGWAAGLVTGTAMVASTGFQSATYPLGPDGLIVPGYAALYSLIVNFAVAAVLTVALNPVAATRGSDQTVPGDYHFEPARRPESPTPVAATA